jgi:hypothetical protein
MSLTNILKMDVLFYYTHLKDSLEVTNAGPKDYEPILYSKSVHNNSPFPVEATKEVDVDISKQKPTTITEDEPKTEVELLQNAKKHEIEVHGYTEEAWNEEIAKNGEHFRKLIKSP